MTLKQIERVQAKIKQIKAALAADKKRWGGFYHDGQGLRYLPPGLYIKIGDYSGGLRYLNWFHKNFPDDIGFPDFLFGWTIILFKTGNLKKAEKKAFQTFCGNTYLFDKFFGRPIQPIDKSESSNLEHPGFADYLEYNHQQIDLADFAEWLRHLTETKKFVQTCDHYIDIHKRLKTESDLEKRRELIRQARLLEEEF